MFVEMKANSLSLGAMLGCRFPELAIPILPQVVEALAEVFEIGVMFE